MEIDADPTARTLTLLSLLQPGTEWTAAALAHRLGTSIRTVRRDVKRLRDLGYTIIARPGPASAYRLGPGVRIPPLLFSEEEITALVAGLRLISPRLGGDSAAERALAKLNQVLPPGLRRRAHAIDDATEVVADTDSGILTQAASAIADAVAEAGRVQFDYRDQDHVQSVRTVEPYRHVFRGGHWYLIGFDLDRDDWRLFRFDRVSRIERIPGTFRRHPFPGESVADWVATDFGRT